MQQSLASYLEDDAAEGLIKPQDKQAAQGLLAKMQAGGQEEQSEPAGEGPGPDNTQPHEAAEPVETEQAEGSEEDDEQMATELAALRAKRKGAA